MKKLPEVNVSFEELYRMLAGPVKLKLLLTGIELGVFNQLSEQVGRGCGKDNRHPPVRGRTLNTPTSPMDLDIGRKA